MNGHKHAVGAAHNKNVGDENSGGKKGWGGKNKAKFRTPLTTGFKLVEVMHVTFYEVLIRIVHLLIFSTPSVEVVD